MDGIIAINKLDPIAVGSFKSAVADGGDTSVALMGDVDARIEAGVGVEEDGAGISGAVIDAEGFPVSIGLRADGVEALGDCKRG